MKHVRDYTDNDDMHIQVVSVLRLNKRERALFARHNATYCAPSELWVQLPFGGMEIVDIHEFMETGLVTLSHWTDKDHWGYVSDEKETQLLESMLCDDIIAIKRIIGHEAPAKKDARWASWWHQLGVA